MYFYSISKWERQVVSFHIEYMLCLNVNTVEPYNDESMSRIVFPCKQCSNVNYIPKMTRP